MKPETLQNAFSDPQILREAAQEARSIARQARDEARESVERMNDQVQLEVARAVGATVELVPAGDDR